jgi:hypothetical protein
MKSKEKIFPIECDIEPKIRKSSLTNQRISYLERENLDKLKKQLINKVFRDLSNKYFHLVKDKNYQITNFIKDFEIEMEKNHDFNNPDYKSFFRKIENVFLSKMNLIENKNIYNDSDIFKRESRYSQMNINCILNKSKKINDFNYNPALIKNDNEKQAITRDEIRILYSPRKNELKTKQNEDEWSKIINNDYNKYLIDNEMKKQIEKNHKMQYSQLLLEQINEKKELKKLELEKEKKYYDEVFLKNLKKEEKKEIEKNEINKKICTETKKSFLKELRGDKV